MASLLEKLLTSLIGMARIGFAKGTKNDRLTDIPFPLPLNQIVVPNRRTSTSNEDTIEDGFRQSWETVTLLMEGIARVGLFGSGVFLHQKAPFSAAPF